MRPRPLSRAPAQVVIAGGGFAALETLLALRSLAGDRVVVTLVTPEPIFLYRPSATAEVFGTGPSQVYDLRAIADDLGVRNHRARLELVGSETKYVRLSSGARLSYDFLVLAVGARARSTVSGALTFRDQRDVPLFRLMLEDLRAGRVRRLVFALPAGFTWPLPLYELALLSSTYAAGHGVDAEITVVSPEQRALEAFGPQASPLVESVFEQRGVRFVGTSAARSVERGGSLALRSGELIEADRVVAVPQLRGQWVSGVPAGWWGFVPTDAAGRVDGLPDVYAAGDVTSFPIKQAGLATQQADRIASQIAAELGGAVAGGSERPVLQARLLGGDNPLYLRTELDTEGRTVAATLVREEAPGGAKVLARYLTEYLDAHQAPGAASLALV